MGIMTNNEKDKLIMNFEDKVEIYGDLDIVKKLQFRKNFEIKEEK